MSHALDRLSLVRPNRHNTIISERRAGSDLGEGQTDHRDRPLRKRERPFSGANLEGKMHGPWEFFRRDGSLMRSGSFDRGKQIGVWRTHDRSGKVLKETNFSSRPRRP